LVTAHVLFAGQVAVLHTEGAVVLPLLPPVPLLPLVPLVPLVPFVPLVSRLRPRSRSLELGTHDLPAGSEWKPALQTQREPDLSVTRLLSAGQEL